MKTGYYIIMAQKTDLYTLLLTYANKQHSPYVEIELFISFISRYAAKYAGERPEWESWSANTNAKFWNELPPLLDEEKCKLLQEKEGQGKLLITDYYADVVAKAYDDPGGPGLPFPDEHSLKITIPPDNLRLLNTDEDLIVYLESPQTSRLPILKFSFMERIPSALALAFQVPRRILEASLFKIQNYLKSHNNLDYFQNKLISQMQGKEPLIREHMNVLDQEPLNALKSMIKPGDFTNLFWAYFYSTVKGEIRNKHDLMAEDIAALQAACIIHVCVTYFKKKVIQEKEREMALVTLEANFERSPYIYKMQDIVKFSDGAGHVLLEMYSDEDLQAFIKTKTTEGEGQNLPPLLIFHDPNKEQLFILKTKIFTVCLRLLSEVRPQIQKVIAKRWYQLTLNFQTEPAMEKDEEFEKLLSTYLEQFSPLLPLFLKDKRLPVVHLELEFIKDGIPKGAKFFENGVMLSLGTLLMISRKTILASTRMLLPFWYTTPILSSVMAFLRKTMKKKKAEISDDEDEENQGGGSGDNSRRHGSKPVSQEKHIKALIMQYENRLVPPNSTLDAYLEELESNWRKLVNKNDQKKIAEDIKNLVKERLRRSLRLQHGRKFNEQSIDSLASAIVFETPLFKQLDSKEQPLVTYVQLLIIKLLSTMK